MDNQFQLPHLTTPIHDPCGWTKSVGLYMQVNRLFFFMLSMKTSKIQISFLLIIELLKIIIIIIIILSTVHFLLLLFFTVHFWLYINLHMPILIISLTKGYIR
jgi:hypothetical protein